MAPGTNGTAVLSLVLWATLFWTVLGLGRTSHLNMELNQWFFFLMKEIRIVQVNLLGLDDPVHNMSERVALQESVNSTGKRIPLQILMGLHTHTPDRE